jgi:alpha-galactosidase
MSMKVGTSAGNAWFLAGCWILAMVAGWSFCGASVWANQTTPEGNVTGTWIAMVSTRTDDVELVFEFKMQDGKITGWERVPFGDWKIIDGKQEGNHIELTVRADIFGRSQDQRISGDVINDEMRISAPVPRRPPQSDESAPPVANAVKRQYPSWNDPVTLHRGTPTPTYRAPIVDYDTLPKLELPELKDLPANGLAQAPPMGWNSWNRFHTKIDDQIVRGIADAMASNGMKDAGYMYILIDDGWQWKRDDAGVLQPNPGFPDMKALADYVHSKGLKLGIYSSPGPKTCAGYVGSYDHEDLDAQTWAEWGIDYLKYDWCSAGHVWKDSDMQAVYQRMGVALQKAGRPIVFSLCQYGRQSVWKWGPRVGGNLWRTTGDISDHWASMSKIGFSQSDLAPYAASGHWNDPDMLEVGNGGMSAVEYRTHFSMWALLAAPLIAGNDLRAMTPEIREILLNKEVIAIDQDALGKQGWRISKDGQAEVWSKALSGGDCAVALFNLGEKPGQVSVKWSLLGLSGDVRVRDLWKHAGLGKSRAQFATEVPAHGVVLLRISHPS